MFSIKFLYARFIQMMHIMAKITAAKSVDSENS